MTQLCHLRDTQKCPKMSLFWHIFRHPFLGFLQVYISIIENWWFWDHKKTRFLRFLKTRRWHFFQKLFDRFLSNNFHDFSVFSETEKVVAATYGQNFKFLKFQVLPKRSRAPVTFYSTNSLKKSIKNRHFWVILGHPNLTLFQDLVEDYQKTSHLPYFSKITLNF